MWKNNGWLTIDGDDVKNCEDFQSLDQAMEGMNIQWVSSECVCVCVCVRICHVCLHVYMCVCHVCLHVFHNTRLLIHVL